MYFLIEFITKCLFVIFCMNVRCCGREDWGELQLMWQVGVMELYNIDNTSMRYVTENTLTRDTVGGQKLEHKGEDNDKPICVASLPI